MEEPNTRSQGEDEILDLDFTDSISANDSKETDFIDIDFKDYDDDEPDVDKYNEIAYDEESIDVDVVDISLPQGKEESLIEVKNEKPQVVVNSVLAKKSLQESKELMTKFNCSVSESVNSLITSENERENLSKYGKTYLEGKPEFFSRDQAVKVIKNFNQSNASLTANDSELYDGTGIEFKELDSVKKLSVEHFLRVIRGKKSLGDRSTIEKRMTNENFKNSFIEVLFDDFIPHYDEETLERISKYKPVVLNKLKVSSSSMSYVCPCCEKTYELKGPLVTFFITDSNNRDCMPALMYCDDCEVLIQLTKRQLNALKKLVLSQDTSNSIFTRRTGSKPCWLYSPSNQQVMEKLPNLCEADDSSDYHDVKKEKEIDVDWDALCKQFMSMQKLYAEESNASGNQVGVSGIAKILAEQDSSYLDLKERALASLIQELKTLNLPELSEYKVRMIELPKLYKNHVDDYFIRLADCIPTEHSVEDYKTGKASLDDFKKDYKKYLDNTNSYARRDELVEQLNNYADGFGCVPISSNIRLSEEDIQDFLSYEPLREVLDKITDLMIINSCCESYLNFYYPRNSSLNKAKNNGSYNHVIGDITDISKRGLMTTKIKKFVDFFCKMLGNRCVNAENFVLYYSSNYEFFSSVASLCNYLLSLDFYNADKMRNHIADNFINEVNNIIKFPRFALLLSLMTQLPKSDANSEFDYYFGENNLNYTKEQKDALVDLRRRKVLVPKILKGDTFEEQYEYYSSLEDFGDVDLVLDDRYVDFLEKNKIGIKAMSFCDDKLLFDDMIMYNLSKDLFLEFSKLNINDLCKVLFINESVCTIFLEKNYDYSNVEFDPGRLIKEIPFLDEELQVVLHDTLIAESDLKSKIAQCDEALRAESEVSPEIKEIIDDYLNKPER